eukprot:403358564
MIYQISNFNRAITKTVIVILLSLALSASTASIPVYKGDLKPEISNEKGQIVFEKLFNCLNQTFYTDQLIKSFKLLDELQQSIETRNLVFEATNDKFEQSKMIKKLNNEQFIKKLKNTRRIYELRFPELTDRTGWIKHLDEEGRKVYYKKEEGRNFITQYVEAIIDAPLINILLLSNEGDLHSTWIPNMSDAKIVKSLSPFRTLLHQKFSPPSPIATREQFLESAAFVIEEDLGLFTCAESISDGDYFGMQVKRQKGTIEMKYSDSITYLKPIGPNQSSFQMIVNADPQLGLIPQWILDWMVRSITGVAMKQVQSSSKNLDKVFWDRFTERQDFYRSIMKRIEPLLEAEKRYSLQGLHIKDSL